MRQIKPKAIKPKIEKSPQCCVVVEQSPSTEWRIERYRRTRPQYNPLCCQQPSTYEIDGKPYCTSHAGKIALEKWIVGDLEERITSTDKADGF